MIDPLSPMVSKLSSRWSPLIYVYIGAPAMFNMSFFANLPENSVKIWLRTDGLVQVESFSEIFDLIIVHQPQIPEEVLPRNKKILYVHQAEDSLWAIEIYTRAQTAKYWEMQIYGSEYIQGITIAVTVSDRAQAHGIKYLGEVR